eukprot:TRINITY_DN4462_c0_g5_i1.p1 TRINITY_DN4462_c0_g5~~TRINITY_DN4462_c0_g5_i1.p1  ORF type:complete len:536 (+),score=47.38 TRINITY_DN4462_c0_g5_i1:40-1608(+)
MQLFSFGEPPYYVTLAIDVLVILSSVALVLRLARKAGVGSLARSFAQAVGFGSRADGEEVDPFSRHVAEKLDFLQKERMKVACTLSLVMLTAVLLISSLAIAGDYHSWRSVQLNYFYCVIVIVFAPIASCCEFTSKWHVHATYGLMMLSTAVILQLVDPPLARRFHVALTLLVCCRFALCSTCIDFKAVVFWDFICTLSDLWKFLAVMGPEQDGYVFMAISCPVFIVTLLISAFMRERTRAHIHHDVSIKAYRLEHSASNLLLEHVCDAVLPVDADLQINGCADRFAAMLMLDSRRCQEGTDVHEFMPLEEDWERFRKQFCAPSTRAEAVPQVSCLNVHLRDGSGNNVRVDVIGVAFKNFNNDVNYKFGVRESSDGQSFPIRDLRGHEARYARTSPNRGPPPQTDAEVLDDQASASTFSRASYHLTGLAKPSFVETSVRGQVLSIVRLMATWNLDTTWRSCCAYHSYLPQIKKVLDDLSCAPCRESIHNDESRQCKECGVLDSFDTNNKCSICGCEATSIPL